MRPRLRWCAITITTLFSLSPAGESGSRNGSLPIAELKQMSLEDLMEVEVALVSRRPERLAEAASAVQVLTRKDIRRSGAATLTEALRLASNLMVGRTNAHDWAVTARGFNGAPLANNSMSDKLLVMIDGRTVYTPLFGGVFWDVQHVLLEDIERIEIVSGPGGTLWGSNAVNGVINVRTRKAAETQGLYLSGGAGTFQRDFAAARAGGSAGPDLHYRAYGQRVDFRNSEGSDGRDREDDWHLTQGGFRLDYTPDASTTVTLQGDQYAGREGVPSGVLMDGQNVLARWTESLSGESNLRVQTYYDRTWRSIPSQSFTDEMHIFDIDAQHRFPLGGRQSVLWGAAYRWMLDDVNVGPTLAFEPARKGAGIFSAFLQDEIALLADRLRMTIGVKLEHNEYSGFEWQPGARAAWTPSDRHTLWGAVSRVVHIPSRFDADVRILLASDPDYTSTKMMAYELGYRLQAIDRLSLSLAAFYNVYDDVRSIDFPPLRFSNGQSADSRGIEVSGHLQAARWWRLRGGYTFFEKDVWSESASVHPASAAFEGLDPRHQAVGQSFMDLPWNIRFDLAFRYVSSLPPSRIPSLTRVPAYATFDARLAWLYRELELSVAGRDLAHRRHREFGNAEIPRSILAKATVRW
jgi:iron complex outermembrane receptor protein